MEVLIRELIPGLSKHFEIVLVSRDRTKEETGSMFAPLIAEQFYWNRDRPSRQAASELAQALAISGVMLAHFHGGIYEWECHKAWQSPLSHSMRAGIACLMTNHLMLPLFSGYSHHERPLWQKALLLPKTWLSKASLLRREEVEITVSKRDQAQLRRYYPPFAGKIRQMYHSRLKKNAEGQPFDQRRKTVLCLAAICERKNQVSLVRAFASIAGKYPEWTLELMGRCETPACLAEIEAITASAGLSDRVLVTSPREDPAPALADAAIFALPSLGEGLPLSLQEALYYECACVGSNVGGVPELIDDGKTGLLVPAGDERALAGALDRLMSDEALRGRLAHAGRQSIVDKGMLAETMKENHVQLYQSILAGKRAADIWPN